MSKNNEENSEPQKEPDKDHDKKHCCGVGDKDTKDIELLDAYSRAVSTVAEAVAPAVVSLHLVRGESGQREPAREGSGSGVVIAPDGYILTNNHVVSGSKLIEVGFQDGTSRQAKLIGQDPPTDLAIIHVDASGLSFAALGNI